MKNAICLSALVAALLFGVGAFAQRTQASPATDSSAQASPVRPAPAAPVTDSAAEASPIASNSGRSVWIAPHTEIAAKLTRSIDSGRLKNGDIVAATLERSVRLSPKGTLAAGTPVEITVIETLPAGHLYAAGEFSLQAERVGPVAVYSDTLTYRGKPGHKDLPDSAPAVGTDAGLAAGAEVVFHVLPQATAASGPPNAGGVAPGSVDGRASGGPPPPGSSAQRNATRGKTNGAQGRTVTLPTNTPQTAERLGKRSTAPNQSSAPEGTSSTQTTQPHQ